MTLFKLSKICNMQSGGTPRRGSSEYYGGDIPWIKISDFKDSIGGVISETEETITREGLKSINNRLFEKGTLLLAMYGSVGKTAFTGIQASCNQAILGITAKDENQLNLKYLKYWFDLNQERLVNQGRGVTLNNISLNIVKKQEIDLPDLETQNKIVAILDKANALVQKRQQTIDLLDELLRAQFLEMFGDPALNNKNWPLLLLNDILLGIDTGWSPVCEEKSRTSNDEWAVLKQGAVSRRKFNPTENKLLPSNMEIKKEITAQKDDLLFSRKNSKEYLGSAAYVFEHHEKLLLADTIFKLKYDKQTVSGIYLCYLFNDLNYRLVIQSLRTGAAGSMPNISQGNLLKHEIPFPPIELQNKFQNIVLSINKKRIQIEDSLSKIENLFNAVLQGAFIGKLDLNVSVELDALLAEIDLQKTENDLYSIITNEEYLLNLVNRLNNQEFETQDLYDKAKHAAFQLLKTDEILVQKYDEDTKSLKLVVK